MRYFNTPAVITKYSNTSELCWRGCGLVGDYTHIFWDCPKIVEFWKSVQKEISQILGVSLTWDPSICILGLIPETDMDRDTTSLLRILLLIAKKTITTSWRETQPPSIAQWRQRLKKVFFMEKITARLQLKTNRFMAKWAKVIQIMPGL